MGCFQSRQDLADQADQARAEQPAEPEEQSVEPEEIDEQEVEPLFTGYCVLQVMLEDDKQGQQQRGGEFINIAKVFAKTNSTFEIARDLLVMQGMIKKFMRSPDQTSPIIVIINAHGNNLGELYDDFSFPGQPYVTSDDFFYGRPIPAGGNTGYSGFFSAVEQPAADSESYGAPPAPPRLVRLIAAQCFGRAFVNGIVAPRPNLELASLAWGENLGYNVDDGQLYDEEGLEKYLRKMILDDVASDRLGLAD